jgi:hypothetical protein
MSAASSADVVRQLMTQFLSSPLRSFPRCNADNDANELVPHKAFLVVASSGYLERSLACPIDGTPTHPSTAQTHQHEPVTSTRKAHDPSPWQYNPHRQPRGTV